MKKLLLAILVVAITICAGGFIFYKLYLPSLVAEVLTKAETPSYVPAFVQNKIEKYKAPINKGAEDIISELHKENISVHEVVKAIDDIPDRDIQAALNELQNENIKTTNQAFDIIARNVNTGFDVEPLRAPFNRNVNAKMIRKFLTDEDFKTYRESFDPAMIKSVTKEILLQKEAEYKTPGN
jgi:hypothetical protein